MIEQSWPGNDETMNQKENYENMQVTRLNPIQGWLEERKEEIQSQR